MHAHNGDWLIVEGRNDHVHARYGEILAVGSGGEPPFRVRWVDNGHEAVVLPGPDAKAVSAGAVEEAHSALAGRVAALEWAVAAARA